MPNYFRRDGTRKSISVEAIHVLWTMCLPLLSKGLSHWFFFRNFMMRHRTWKTTITTFQFAAKIWDRIGWIFVPSSACNIYAYPMPMQSVRNFIFTSSYNSAICDWLIYRLSGPYFPGVQRHCTASLARSAQNINDIEFYPLILIFINFLMCGIHTYIWRKTFLIYIQIDFYIGK